MRSKKKKSSLRAGILFLSALIFLILISLIFKGIDVIRRSNFDGKNAYAFSVDQKDGVSVIHISPYDSTAAFVRILPNEINKDNLSEELAVPISSYIKSEDYLGNNPKDIILKVLFSYGRTDTDLTIIDLVRLSMLVPSNLKKTTINIDWDGKTIDSTIKNFFRDPRIEEEKVSIEIVNSTGEQGIATRMGRLITNMGGNVVLLKNSEKNEKHSSVSYFGEDGYTVKKISKYFDIEKRKNLEKGISDIVITIGEDLIDSGKF